MPVEIKVPSVGESITEGTIARWLKNDGDSVQQDEPLFELETEKATQEIPSPAAGVLHTKSQAGQSVAIGSVVGTIDPTPRGESASPAGKPAKPQAAPEQHLSPAARAVAAEHGVDTGALQGSGRHGVVLKEDVQKHLEKRTAKPQAVAHDGKPRTPQQAETREPMSAIRQRI